VLCTHVKRVSTVKWVLRVLCVDAQGLWAWISTHLPADGCADEETDCIDPAQSSSHTVAIMIRVAMSAASLPRCCAGDEIISQQLSFGERAYWEGVVALIGLTLALNLIAYWTLRRCLVDC
jgi:hypothetical protein